MPYQSFPLSHRLAHSHEFDAVFNQSDARISCPSLLILAKRNNHGFNRLGMIVSKKSIPRAVQRSRVKRLIRESFRHTRPAGPLGFDVVVLTRPKVNQEADLMALLIRSFATVSEKMSQVKAATEQVS